jgi:hypothetical protein
MGGVSGDETGLLYFNTFDFAGVSRYTWVDGTNNVLTEQVAGGITTYTWPAQTLNGGISARAINHVGIESDPQSFDVKIYPTLAVSSDGPFTGKPNNAVTLSGSINGLGYPASYQWAVQTDPANATLTNLTASDQPDATYTWTTVGLDQAETVDVRLDATVTTTEGLAISGSHLTTVTLDAATPTAPPGDPYCGGIVGGNFTPIQLTGNLPSVVEDVDVGKIVAWDWAVGIADVTGALKGATINEGSAFMLTDAVGSTNGQIEYTDLPLGDAFTVEGEFWSGGGTGADAFFVYLWNTDTPRRRKRQRRLCDCLR